MDYFFYTLYKILITLKTGGKLMNNNFKDSKSVEQQFSQLIQNKQQFVKNAQFSNSNNNNENKNNDNKNKNKNKNKDNKNNNKDNKNNNNNNIK